MSMPYYVSPEQLMKDRADFARKGIARGRSVVVLGYAGGLAFVAENTSSSLHKVSEIYDRIGFAAVGKYNEFEALRVSGIQYADLRGYSYDRSDVTARGLSNKYAQILGSVFTTENKPLEVELAVGQVGESQKTDQLYRLTYDGMVVEEDGYVAMGGSSDKITSVLKEKWSTGLILDEALRLAVGALAIDPATGNRRDLGPDQLEVAVLDRFRSRRKFRRLGPALVGKLLNVDDPTKDIPSVDDKRPGSHDVLSGEDS